jgi:23S rRNA (guanosine2251-2'-O)-methyltransferase
MNKREILVLENIRSVYNVGAIFRTADAIGIEKIYLIGTTPTPVDRFGRDRKDLHKCALGAEKSVVWQYFSKTSDALAEIKKEGYKILSLEQSDKSVDYKSAEIHEKSALIVGNEVDGVSQEALSQSDQIIEIPMRGKKESLNVSVATGIALFELFG